MRATATRRVDHGSVTAETALALPAVVLVLTVLLAVGQVVEAQLRCTDAARVAARAAARGEPDATVRGLAGTAAPAGARVAVARSGELLAVTVEVVVSLPVPGLPVLTVTGRSVAPAEPDAGPDAGAAP